MMSDDGSSDLEDEPLSTKVTNTSWLVVVVRAEDSLTP